MVPEEFAKRRDNPENWTPIARDSVDVIRRLLAFDEEHAFIKRRAGADAARRLVDSRRRIYFLWLREMHKEGRAISAKYWARKADPIEAASFELRYQSAIARLAWLGALRFAGWDRREEILEAYRSLVRLYHPPAPVAMIAS